MDEAVWDIGYLFASILFIIGLPLAFKVASGISYALKE